MELIPVSLQRQGEAGLVIQWSDGSRTQYTAAQLRSACPCATCKEKHGPSGPASDEGSGSRAGMAKSLPVLSMAEARPLAIQGMRPVGNYAYNIAFSDGHDSGLYTFDYLLAIGRPTEAEQGH